MSEGSKTRPMGKVDAQGRVIPTSYDDLAFRAEYTGTNMIYKGFSRAGKAEGDLAWQIAMLSYDSDNLISVTWPEDADGNASTEYEFSWTARASYTYV